MPGIFGKIRFAAIALAISASAAHADCADDAAIAAYVADFRAKTPTKALGAGGTMAQAQCTQAKLVTALVPYMGPVIGYKVGLTSTPAQERFGVDEPVAGVLYRDMILPDGAEVPTDFGAGPLFEADLILVVGNAAINEATTPEEAILHISAAHPFIELPDLIFAPGEPINGVTLTANGVAPRLGVLGDAVTYEDPASFLAALAAMEVTVSDAEGGVMAKAPGAAVLGNPVNAVLWLISKGYELQAGDMVSVGSIGPLLPPAKAMGRAEVRYAGLAGDPVVTVVFTP